MIKVNVYFQVGCIVGMKASECSECILIDLVVLTSCLEKQDKEFQMHHYKHTI